MAKFCSNCGTGLMDAARFCSSCGTPCPALPQVAPQPIPQATPQLTEKQMALRDAPYALNRPNQPWVVTVEGETIVARWKWMDATFFAPHEVSNEVREYAFTAVLSDNQTWREVDRTDNKASNVRMSGGKLSLGGSTSTFAGKQNQKSFEFGVGKNNQTGQAGFIVFKFDTTPVKESIRAYLKNRGWKKAGLFG